jgi:hypothetical protein
MHFNLETGLLVSGSDDTSIRAWDIFFFFFFFLIATKEIKKTRRLCSDPFLGSQCRKASTWYQPNRDWTPPNDTARKGTLSVVPSLILASWQVFLSPSSLSFVSRSCYLSNKLFF